MLGGAPLPGPPPPRLTCFTGSVRRGHGWRAAKWARGGGSCRRWPAGATARLDRGQGGWGAGARAWGGAEARAWPGGGAPRAEAAAARSPPAGASRRRCGAGSRPGRPTGPGARGYGPRRRAGRPRSGARGGAERPRRRDGEPAAVAGDSAGEGVGKLEKVTGMLTVLMDWMEEGRKMDIDEGGRARWSFNGGRVQRVRFQPGLGTAELRNGWRRQRARRRRLWHEGSRRGGELWPEGERWRGSGYSARARRKKGIRTRSLQARDWISYAHEGRGSPARATRGVAGDRSRRAQQRYREEQ